VPLTQKVHLVEIMVYYDKCSDAHLENARAHNQLSKKYIMEHRIWQNKIHIILLGAWEQLVKAKNKNNLRTKLSSVQLT